MKNSGFVVVVLLVWVLFMVYSWKPKSNEIKIPQVNDVVKTKTIEFLDSKDGYAQISLSKDGKDYTDWKDALMISGHSYYKIRRIK